MAWCKLSFELTPDQADRLEALLEEAGALALTREPLDDSAPLFDEPGVPQEGWERLRLSALFPHETRLPPLLDALGGAWGGELPPHVAAMLHDRDWHAAWRESLRPMRIGPRLWICPSWLEPPEPEAVNLVLDPGMAFGTGSHETTALCLEWLQEWPGLPGASVIDYGCGSGILAIAALLLGAGEARAVDIDRTALAVTRDNARANAVAERLITGGVDLELEPAHLLMANILAGPLMELAPRFAPLVRPGGHLLLSGLLTGQAAEVASHYREAFEMEPPVARGEWVLLHGRRRE